MTFAEKLKKLRKEKRATQAEVARAVEIGLRTYKGYEIGEYTPLEYKTYVRLANFFGVDLNYLFGVSEDGAENTDPNLNFTLKKDRLLREAELYFTDESTTYIEKQLIFFELMDLFYHATGRGRRRIERQKKDGLSEFERLTDERRELILMTEYGVENPEIGNYRVKKIDTDLIKKGEVKGSFLDMIEEKRKENKKSKKK